MATCIVLSIRCITTSADISYSEIYADAVEESCAKHDRMLANVDINQYNYNALGYALSDITGDGLCELIVIQVTNKHDAEYWLYSTDGDSSFYMGSFHCDARTDGSLYGYRQGIIFEEAYNRAKSIILEHREQLDELAERLFELEVLFREDLERIYGPRQAEIEEKKQAEAQSDIHELAQSAESDDADNTTAPKPEEQ